MEEKKITLITDIAFSSKRVEEIFEVPATKVLFEQFVGKEEIGKELEALKNELAGCYKLEKILLKESREKIDNEIAQDVEKANEEVMIQLKTCVMAASLEGVIGGKSLNQAIQDTLRKMLKDSAVFETMIKAIDDRISEMRAHIFMGHVVSNLI